MDDGFSYNTIEAEFIDQKTCIHVSNRSPKPIYFMKDQPIAFFDLRSIGYFDPSSAQDLVKTKIPHTYVTSFTSMVDSSADRFQSSLTPVTDTQDPYLWLKLDDPRRFQTDREILETAIDLSESCLTDTQHFEFLNVLEKYKDAFSLRDEIGLVPNMEVHLELHDKTPFFIHPFSVKEEMKQKLTKK